MQRLLLIVLLLPLAVCAQQTRPQGPGADPMARLRPFLGHWNVHHTLWSQTGKSTEEFEGTAEIYFVANGTVLVVDESTPDRRYHFVGYHSYDSQRGKYINWTATSAMVLAWGEGEFEANREVFRTHRLDPRTGQPDLLIGRGVWELVGPDKHIFRAMRVQADGAEIPFKEEVYTRMAK